MTKYSHLLIFSLLSIIIWTALVYLSGTKAISIEKEKTIELAKKEAVTVFNKDLALRQWATEHGGIYVPISDKTPSNPYLSHIKNRDLDIYPNLKLTLMNPAYMIRQVMEDYEEKYGTKGIITSQIQMNPINKPDPWSEKALARLHAGAKEVFEVEETESGHFLHLIRPLWTQEKCLKCHAIQGYQVGDLRGGIGVKVDMGPYLKLQHISISSISRTLFTVWMIGLLGIFVFAFWGRSRIVLEKSILLALQEKNKKLLESETSMSTILNNSQDVIVKMDRDFRHVFANPSLYEATGLSEQHYLGKTNREIGMPEHLCSFWREKHEIVFKTRQPICFEFHFNTIDKGERFFQAIVCPELNNAKEVVSIVSFMRDITDLKRVEQEKENVIEELEKKIAEIKTLHGLIPICMHCKQIRNEDGYWERLEKYITEHSDAHFSHGLCEECADKHYPGCIKPKQP